MLSPLSGLYRAVTRTRLAAYKAGLLKTTRLPVPVISVGNLTTGGTGKTPLVEWVCRTLAQNKKRVCILTRGYGRPNAGSRVVVSDGGTVLANSVEAGDEPFLLAQNLKGLAAVISDSNRVAAGKWAIDNLGSEVFVLDDGFQHLALERDLDIVTVDATNPWGGGKLLPAGRLREPRSGLSRSDCVIVTRADQNEALVSLEAEIHRLNADCPVVRSKMTVNGIARMNSLLSGEPVSPTLPVAAFCAIGNPGSFFALLRHAEINPVFTRAFRDHHQYTQADIDALIQDSKRAGAQSIITTAKDSVKLQQIKFGLPGYVLNIEISIAEEARIIQMVKTAAG
jgi:tetraacyldisaccharide 4'-kinase